MAPLPSLRRAWYSIDLPGYREGRSTFSQFDPAGLPPIERELDDKLDWLLEQPVAGAGAIIGKMDAADLRAQKAVLDGSGLVLPSSFMEFVASPAPASRIRSATRSYVELPEFVCNVLGGGALIHFLADQQWVLHWFLYVGPDGSEAVVAAWPPYGFENQLEFDYEADDLATFDPDTADAVVCASSFSEFLYRYWIENEIFFRLGRGELTPEQRRYAEHYR